MLVKLDSTLNPLIFLVFEIFFGFDTHKPNALIVKEGGREFVGVNALNVN